MEVKVEELWGPSETVHVDDISAWTIDDLKNRLADTPSFQDLPPDQMLLTLGPCQPYTYAPPSSTLASLGIGDSSSSPKINLRRLASSPDPRLNCVIKKSCLGFYHEKDFQGLNDLHVRWRMEGKGMGWKVVPFTHEFVVKDALNKGSTEVERMFWEEVKNAAPEGFDSTIKYKVWCIDAGCRHILMADSASGGVDLKRVCLDEYERYVLYVDVQPASKAPACNLRYPK